MWHGILSKITTTPEASVTGRLAQLLYAAELVDTTHQLKWDEPGFLKAPRHGFSVDITPGRLELRTAAG